MYDPNDPRARLAGQAPAAAPRPAERFAPACYAPLAATEPTLRDATQTTWCVHAANFVVVWSDAQAGACFTTDAAPDESMLVLPDAQTEVDVVAGDERVRLTGRRVAILPPGAHRVDVIRPGRVIRALTRASAGPLAQPPTAAAAETADDPNAAPLRPWPAPPAGWRIRHYPMDATPVAGAFGRIWRCSSFMLPYVPASRGPRDTTRLSPHAHADFQQVNLVLDGEIEFNLRWPWVANKAHWRRDEHVRVAAPAVVVIPAQAIHTNERRSDGINDVFDLYCPPRHDFAAAGWSLNHDEYPLPDA